MGTDINFRKHLGRTYGTYIGLPAFDPSAAAYFAATGITGATQQTAIDNLVKGLKADGLWSKMKAVYPFVTDNRNLFSYTEDFNNSYWNRSAITITANSTTAPNGTLTADSIVENTANTDHYLGVFNGLTLTASPYTLSVYVKKAGRDWFSLGLYNGTDSKYAWFNLNTGAIGTIQSGITASIESVGNGWYRCSITRTMAAVSTNYIGIVPTIADGGGAYLGNGTTSTYVWHPQLELGSTATTYQPMLGSQQAFISSQFKYNLVNPVDSDAAFRLVFNGGWTHSSNGATPNGTNGYADTYFNPSIQSTPTNISGGVYSRTNSVVQSASFGAIEPSGQGLALYIKLTDNNTYAAANDWAGTGPANIVSNTTGFYIVNRFSDVLKKLYRNNSTIMSIAPVVSTVANSNVYFGARNITGIGASLYDTRNYSFFFLGNSLTDTEAANLYTRVQTFNQALSRQVGVPIVSDADAQAFLNSADITDITQANAINTLVTDLKAQGLWTKMKAIYPFVGGTASTHKYNLKDPRDLDAAYRLVFNGGWTHSSTGATPNGTNGYADTKLVPSSVLTLNSTHLSYYSRTNNTFDAAEIGSALGGSQQLQIITNFTGISYDAINNAPAGTARSWTTDAMFVASRTASNLYKSYRNSSIVATYTTASGSLPTLPIYVGGRAGASLIPTNRQCAFSSIGDGLNDTEATALYNAVNNYQVALSRNV